MTEISICEAEAVATGTNKRIGEAQIVIGEAVAGATTTKRVGNETKKTLSAAVAIATKANQIISEPSIIKDAPKIMGGRSTCFN